MGDEENLPGGEPTRAIPVVGPDAEATRLERPIPPYDENKQPGGYVPPVVTPARDGEGPGLFAPLVTVGLLSILLGIGVGYLLFHDTGSSTPAATTTTTSTALATTSTVPTTSTTQVTSTTKKAATSTTVHSTSTTAGKSSTTSSTAAKVTTTTY